ncbi:YSNK protein, partial [Atractosteus spatula]|nr:YSNK protein [Atractosteus spatula]
MQIPMVGKHWLLAVLAPLVIGLVWLSYNRCSLRPVNFPAPGPKHSLPCPKYLLEETIYPIKDTKHFIVSAYEDHREKRLTHVIGIVLRNSLEPLSCIFCCENGNTFQTRAQVNIHTDHFGFPFATTDLLCEENPECNASHVTIEREERKRGGRLFLPIRNREKTEGDFPYEFTVCISNLFDDYNNVLQFIQTMEVYKILGIQKVTIYNTSCGPQMDKVLHYYSEEGLLEVVPWPITKFLNPSHGWNFAEHKGDLHYYGQLTTLNDCIYRNMYKSKYLLLNDMDEIIMPYKHGRLHELMGNLSAQNPKVGVFVVENHIFPKTMFDDNKTFDLPLWREVPGINILEHIYREPVRKNVFNPTKLIINPRKVVQTSVHSVLKTYGETFRIPPDVCRIIHVRLPLQGHLTKEQLLVDTKLWDYQQELVPKINNVIHKSGILK